MKVAALQMVSGSQLQANLQQAQALLQQASQAGAELAVLPEYFCLMGERETDKLALAETPGSGPIQDFLASAARQFGLWIVGGTLPLQSPKPESPPREPSLRSVLSRRAGGTPALPGKPLGRPGEFLERVANACLVFDPNGQPVARYDKMHLFCYDNGRERYDEAAVLNAGSEPVAFDLCERSGQRWRVGLSVCYDLRFPELYRHLQADLLLLPAAFTHGTGQAHWEVLLRARAIENLAFVAASAQGGQHDNGRQTWGQSLLIDPWGVVLAERASGVGVVLAELDWARLQQVRQQLPALQHRRL